MSTTLFILCLLLLISITSFLCSVFMNDDKDNNNSNDYYLLKQENKRLTQLLLKEEPKKIKFKTLLQDKRAEIKHLNKNKCYIVRQRGYYLGLFVDGWKLSGNQRHAYKFKNYKKAKKQLLKFIEFCDV